MASNGLASKRPELTAKLAAWRRAVAAYHASPLFWPGAGPEPAAAPCQISDDECPGASKALMALVGASRDLAAVAVGLVDVSVLLKFARDLEDAEVTIEMNSEGCAYSTTTAELLVEQLELLTRPVVNPHRLADTGPGHTLDAVCEAILGAKGGDAALLIEGDETVHSAVKQRVGNRVDPKKAADYLAPRGVLCREGWILRDGDKILLTEQGASEGMRRLEEKRRREQKRKP